MAREMLALTPFLLMLGSASAFHLSAFRPHVHSRPIPIIQMALPEAVVEACAAKGVSRNPEGIEILWNKLVDLYGSQDLALQAVRQNALVIAPLYSTPELLDESYDSLVTNIGKEEVIEIMCKNPAVLTCGDALATADASEIRNIAAFRSVVDAIPPSAIWAVIISFSAAIGFRIAQVKFGL